MEIKYSDFEIWLHGLFKFNWDQKRKWYREEYLKSDHWKKFSRWRKYSGFAKFMGWNRCHDCRGNDMFGSLDLHHLTYAHLWWELPWDVMQLCRGCHNVREAAKNKGWQYR